MHASISLSPVPITSREPLPGLLSHLPASPDADFCGSTLGYVFERQQPALERGATPRLRANETTDRPNRKRFSQPPLPSAAALTGTNRRLNWFCLRLFT